MLENDQESELPSGTERSPEHLEALQTQSPGRIQKTTPNSGLLYGFPQNFAERGLAKRRRAKTVKTLPKSYSRKQLLGVVAGPCSVDVRFPRGGARVPGN